MNILNNTFLGNLCTVLKGRVFLNVIWYVVDVTICKSIAVTITIQRQIRSIHYQTTGEFMLVTYALFFARTTKYPLFYTIQRNISCLRQFIKLSARIELRYKVALVLSPYSFWWLRETLARMNTRRECI